MRNPNVDITNESAGMVTLFGGRLMYVRHNDGTDELVRVRQILLGEYDTAVGLLKDEFAFTAFATTAPDRESSPRTKEWVLGLEPESYELLQVATQKVNAAGFLALCGPKPPRQKIQPPERQRSRRPAARQQTLAEIIALTAADAEITFPEAMRHSWEQLQMMKRAAQKKWAARMLKFSQVMVAASGDNDTWMEKQKALIEEINE